MDSNDFRELDLQLGEAQAEIRRLQAEIEARDLRIKDLQSLLNRIIATAQESYSLRTKGVGRFPEASGKEISKEAF